MMTRNELELIRYEDLTWPQVRSLSRDLPLLIPLGTGPLDTRAAAEALSVRQLGLLPPIPYGFRRKVAHPLGALAVGPGLFRRVLLGTQRELHRQGFRRVVFVDAHAVRGWVAPRALQFLTLPGSPADPTAPEFWPDLTDRVVVISTGHTEQHGPHLPLATDSIIAQALADGISRAAPDLAFCLPVFPYGVSTHTRQFPGTLNLGGRTFEDFFLAVVGRLVDLGARVLFFSNTHGGNHSFLVNVVKLAGERWPQAFIATEWLHTTGPALARLRSSPLGGMGHAGELETSYMLHLRPELVHPELGVTEMDFITTPNYSMDWIEGGRLIANPPWTDDTSTGSYGDPTAATAQKGASWLEAAIAQRVESLEEARTQWRLRQARRARGKAGVEIDQNGSIINHE